MLVSSPLSLSSQPFKHSHRTLEENPPNNYNFCRSNPCASPICVQQKETKKETRSFVSSSNPIPPLIFISFFFWFLLTLVSRCSLSFRLRRVRDCLTFNLGPSLPASNSMSAALTGPFHAPRSRFRSPPPSSRTRTIWRASAFVRTPNTPAGFLPFFSIKFLKFLKL